MSQILLHSITGAYGEKVDSDWRWPNGYYHQRLFKSTRSFSGSLILKKFMNKSLEGGLGDSVLENSPRTLGSQIPRDNFKFCRFVDQASVIDEHLCPTHGSALRLFEINCKILLYILSL